jgi:hypothetical protein
MHTKTKKKYRDRKLNGSARKMAILFLNEEGYPRKESKFDFLDSQGPTKKLENERT